MSKKKVIGLSLDPKVIDDLDKLAEKIGLSRSQLANFILDRQMHITVTINTDYPDDQDEDQESDE